MELLEESDTDWLECPPDFPGGHSLQDLDVRALTGCTILAVEREGVATTNPDPGEQLRSGDRLLVLGERENLARLKALLEEVRAAG
jgi:K+/H+ antiporter YhaU regulatory subunit KhtT